ncbi:MAG: hypothetical protein ACXAE3_13050 [Candidatus Kariarchaeaceae archaeon]
MINLVKPARRVALTNFLLFALALLLIQFDPLLFSTNWTYPLYVSLATLVLILDLYFTFHMVKALYGRFEIPYSRLMTAYVIVSALTRGLVILQLIIGSQGSIDIMMKFGAGITASLFGLLLLEVVSFEFPHREKLRFIAVANLVGIIVFLGPYFRNIFLFLKVVLPLPASLTYILVAFDIDKDQTAIIPEISDEV